MKTRIKICGITRLEDGLAAARLGADAIGLVFYEPSPRAVTPEQARAIADVLPPFVTTVGLFVNAEAARVREVLAAVPLQMLQFHGDESPKFCSGFDRPFLKALRVRAGVDLLQCVKDFKCASGLLLDAWVEGMRGGTGATFDWSLVPRQLPLPVVLSGGLDPSNIQSAVRAVQPWAVDVSSGVESAKGIKDAAKIEAFINGVRNADL
ncbi:MAG: phosphoribosylanthranilate isomerase [Betaproteobacteria bacterium]|jgi:phosphoribosylanthranilate isomerase|nr:phosphoribosylanthranilate isomerase [Betaproteobacteria bacterium]